MFKFKLQKALEIKEKEEEEKRIELLEKQKILERELGKLSEIEDEITKTLDSYSMSKNGSLDINTMLSYENFLKKLKGNKESQIEIVELYKNRVEECKENFLEARKDKKIFEKLKEKSYEKYMEESLREEQKFIDELSSNMYNRRR